MCVFFAVQVRYSSKKRKAQFSLLALVSKSAKGQNIIPFIAQEWFDRITHTAFTGICLFVVSIYTCILKTWDARRCTEYISVKHKKHERNNLLAFRHNCGPRWLYILIKLKQQSIIFRVNFPCSSSLVKYTHRWGGRVFRSKTLGALRPCCCTCKKFFASCEIPWRRLRVLFRVPPT